MQLNTHRIIFEPNQILSSQHKPAFPRATSQ